MKQILRMLVFQKTYGIKNFLCGLCNTNQINAFNFEIGHIKSKAHGGTDKLDNLTAICRTCNASSGKLNYNTAHEIIKNLKK